MTVTPFFQRKQNILSSLLDSCGDKSRKGSVDAPIQDIIDLINQQPYFYTTSSCSGRISVFAEPTEVTRATGKKGGEWVFASHERSDAQEVLMKIKERACSGARLVLRFEPFILHAECESMEAARLLLLAAREAGYRESGITVGGRIMVGIRCSLRLEAPVADAGLLLVPDQYILYLVALANEKFAENEARIAKLEERLKIAFNRHEPQVQGSRPSQQHTRLQLSLTKATQDPNLIIEATTTNSLSNSSASTLVTGKEASYDLHQGLSPQLKVPLEVALAAAKESRLPGLSGRSRRKQSALLSKSHHFDTVGANLSAKLPSDRTAVEDLGLPRRLLGKQLNILKRIKAVEKALALRHEADRSRPLATHVKSCSAVSTSEQLLTQKDRGGLANGYVSGTMNSMTHKSLPALRPSTAAVEAPFIPPQELSQVLATATLEAPFIPPQELSQVLATAAVQKAAISAISGEASSSTEASPLNDGQPLNDVIKWHALPLNKQCSVWSTLPKIPHPSGIYSGIDSTGMDGGVSPALQDGFFKPLSSPEVLQRWGHASVVHQGRLIVIGGYGGEGSHQRRSDVLLFACGEWMEVTTTGGEGFVPRMGHAAILTGDAGVLVIGGRTSPSDALGDVWRLDLLSWHWQLITPSVIGSQSEQGTQLAGTTQRERPQTWPGRFRHAAVAHEGVVYVFGGRGGDGSSLNDLWALHCSKPASRIEEAATGRTEAAGGGWKWIRLPAGPAASLSAALVNPANPLRNEDILITPDGHDSKARSSEGSGGDCICWPSPRHSHAVAVLDDVLYLHGGTSEYGQQYSDMYCLKLSEAQRCMETQVRETEEGCLDEPQGSQHGLANAIAVEGLLTEPANMSPGKPLHNSLQWEAVLNNVHSLPNSSSTHPFSSSSLIPSSSPPSCFSHTLTAWPETGCLLLMGGYPTHEHHNRLYLFHTKSQSWHYIHVAVTPGTSHSHFQGIKTGKQQHKASAASAGTSISSTAGHALPVFVPVRHTAAILDIPPSCLVLGEGHHSRVMAQAAAGTAAILDIPPSCLVLGEGHHSRVIAQAAAGTSPVAERMDHVTSIIGAGEHAEVMMRSPTTSSPTLMLVGGGAFCFSFGSVFSGVWTLALSQLSLAAFPQLSCPQRTTPAAAPSSTDVNSNTTGSLDLMKSAVLSDLANLDLDLVDPSCTWVIQVQSHLAKGVKDAVKDAGWLDKSKKAGVLKATPAPSAAGHVLLHNGSATNGGNIMDRGTDAGPPCSYVQLPLHSQAVQALKQAVMLGTESSSAAQLLVMKALLSGDAKLLTTVVTHSSKHIVDPKTLMRTAVMNLLLEQQQQVRRTHDEPAAEPGSTKQQLPWPSSRVMDELLEDLPVKWERLGDLALLPEGCLVHPAWSCILPDLGGLWAAMAKALGVRRLAKQAKVANTGTRDSQAIMLLGSDGWVEHKEGGVTFCLDVTKCMFSSGNVTERMRIGKLKCSGETVVDLYTGIGYYTIPILACAGADKVYACEWNTNAVTALHRNLSANHIPPDRCVVLQGDCRLRAPQSVADRVLLGLLPSSQGGWQTAVLALKPTGGWLHVHENVLDKAEGEWVETAVQRIQSLTRAIQGRQHWVVSVRHVERVKWYAPHIRHIVVDMELRPTPSVSAVLPSTAEAQECTASRWISTGAVSANDASFNGDLRGLHEDGSRTSVSKRGTSERTGAAEAEAVTGPESSYWFRSPLTELPRVKEVVVPSAESNIETHQLLWQWFDLQVSRQREPVLLKGLDLGPAVQKWTPEYLADLPSSSTTQVSVHVTHESSGCLDFVNKNFSFKNMTLKELVQAVNKADVSSKADSNSDQLGSHNRDSEPAGSAAAAAAFQNTTCTKYYLRSVGVNPRKEPAHLHASFPDLAQDIQLPVSLLPPDMPLFSSVLRVGSPGLRLWTHYDVMDNVLMQIRGTKQVLLWPPSDYDNLYMEGSSSPIIGVLDPDLIKYRRYSSAKPVLCTLTPGTALFIPSLWLHNVFSEPGSEASISVNAFWRHLPVEFYEKKDLYGNRDLVQANQADEEVGKVCNLLKELPGHYRAFYARRLITRLTQQLLKDT